MSESTAIVASSDMFMPVMDIRQAKARRDALISFVKGIMIEGQDYGKIPGTDKPTLLKPGAEKLVTFFGMSPVFVSERIVENFGDDGSEPLFFYRYRCELYRSGVLVGSGIGSCNSRESKYRYRNSERVCPQCGKPAIIKGKADYGGGWLCFAKKGGCGAKFNDNDPGIVNQSVGKVPNPDVADLVNTIDKMAQKRALIAATLISVNASEFFTQDVEDMAIDAEYSVAPAPPSSQSSAPTPAARQAAQRQASQARPTSVTPVTDDPASIFAPAPVTPPASPPASTSELITEAQRRHLHAVGTQLYMTDWNAKRHALVKAITKGRTESSKDLTADEAQRLISGIEEKLGEVLRAEQITLENVPELKP